MKGTSLLILVVVAAVFSGWRACQQTTYVRVEEVPILSEEQFDAMQKELRRVQGPKLPEGYVDTSFLPEDCTWRLMWGFDNVTQRWAAVWVAWPADPSWHNEVKEEPASQPESFQADTKQRVRVLFFTADWCPACVAMKPIVSKLQAEGLEIEEIDHDKAPSRAAEYGVRLLPTFIRLLDERETTRATGVIREDDLRAYFRSDQ